MKFMIKREKRDHTRWRTQGLGQKSSGEGEEVEWEVFGREKRVFLSREIREKWKKIVEKIYIEKQSLMDRELLRICQALILNKFSCRSAIESYQRQRKLDGLNSYRVAIEQAERFSMDRESIEKLSR